MTERLCECGCGEPALYAARHVKSSFRSPRRFDLWEERDMGFATPCRIWTGAMGSARNGVPRYGRITYLGKVYSAHRFLYGREHGVLPKDVQLHHLCGITLCVNVEHLVPLNARDHTRADRAKVDPDHVRYIRIAKKPTIVIARELGISQSLVQQIKRGRLWSDIE